MAAKLGALSPFGPGSDTRRTTTAEAALGDRKYDASFPGNEFTYIKAGASIAQYDAVRFAGSTLGFDDVRPTSAANQVVIGAATAAFASGDYGYVQTRGVATVKTVVSTTAGVAVVTNGTAGTLAACTAADTTFSNAVCLVTGVAAGSAVAFL